MAESSWTILYNQALHSQPQQLLANVKMAREAIRSRWCAIASGTVIADVGERRALIVALNDLHVLHAAFRAC